MKKTNEEAKEIISEPIKKTNEKPSKVSTKNGTVNCSYSLNVRSTPEVGNNIIGSLNNGDTVAITTSYSDPVFYKINYKGRNAFVMKKYIEE